MPSSSPLTSNVSHEPHVQDVLDDSPEPARAVSLVLEFHAATQSSTSARSAVARGRHVLSDGACLLIRRG